MSTPSTLSIDPFQTKLLSLKQAAEKLGSLTRGRPVAAATLWRWINEGIKTRSLKTVRLRAIRVGRSYATTADAVNEFLAAVNDDSSAAAAAPAETRPEKKPSRSSSRARKELAAAGW